MRPLSASPLLAFLVCFLNAIPLSAQAPPAAAAAVPAVAGKPPAAAAAAADLPPAYITIKKPDPVNKDAVRAAEKAQVQNMIAQQMEVAPYYLATLHLRVGKEVRIVRIQLFNNEAPVTVANFIRQANEGTYRGMAVHRAIRGFLVQMGDPLTRDESKRDEWGLGGGEGGTLPPEIKLPHQVGSLAMARLNNNVNPGKRSSATQFYIALGTLKKLDGEYTVFGQVLSGMDVFQEISRSLTDTNDTPLDRFEIVSLAIDKTTRPPAVVASASSREDSILTITPRRSALKVKSEFEQSPFSKFMRRLW